MTHTLVSLPYQLSALEPVISAETLDFHHGKHHKAYVEKLNALIPGTEFEEMTLEEVVRSAKGQIFNNAGQVWNHNFYWQSLSPDAGADLPRGELANEIDQSFGSFDRFHEVFSKAAAGVFGSGWAWLSWDPKSQRLVIETTPNGENPLHKKEGHHALLTCDVWEHAYYIDYRNDRAKYLRRIWEVMNWRFAERNFAEARASTADAA